VRTGYAVAAPTGWCVCDVITTGVEKIAPSCLVLQQNPHKEQSTKMVKNMKIGIKISISTDAYDFCFEF